MQNEGPQKKTCRRCGGIGYVMVYEAPHVKRKYCDCETGKRRKKFITEMAKSRDIEPVWELLTV